VFEFTVFVNVKIDSLKDVSKSKPLKVNRIAKKNNETTNTIIDKKYL